MVKSKRFWKYWTSRYLFCSLLNFCTPTMSTLIGEFLPWLHEESSGELLISKSLWQLNWNLWNRTQASTICKCSPGYQCTVKEENCYVILGMIIGSLVNGVQHKHTDADEKQNSSALTSPLREGCHAGPPRVLHWGQETVSWSCERKFMYGK